MIMTYEWHGRGRYTTARRDNECTWEPHTGAVPLSDGESVSRREGAGTWSRSIR